MRQLLPYLSLGLLLLAVFSWWIWDAVAPSAAAQGLGPRQRRSSFRRVASHRDLGERIFGPEDWDFVSSETPSEIRRMFQRERTVRALAWLRRTRSHVIQVMNMHLAVAQQNQDLELTTEMRLALSYFLFLFLCNCLI